MSFAPDHKDPSVTDPDASIAKVVEADQRGSIRSGPHKNYSFAASAWLLALATPLLFFPRVLSLIFSNLLTETPDAEGAAEVIRQLNVLERSLAGLTGFALTALALILVIQTGAVPLTSSISSGESLQTAPFRTPTTIVSMLFFAALAWYAWELNMWLVTGVSGVLTVWGLWAVIFGSESIVNKKHLDRNSGVSNFPFDNKHAEGKKTL
ncbi:hypothetical protein T439DRAFT_320604 [Meredithblackwellia eburnea MCA 4105]